MNWQTLSLTVPSTGTCTLPLNSMFGGNGDGETYSFFDNARIAPAPDVAKLIGLGGMIIARKRR